MTRVPIPSEITNVKRQHKDGTKTSTTHQLRTDQGRSAKVNTDI